MCKATTNKMCQCCVTCPLSQTKQVPLPLAACVSFSGLRYHCQFHALKRAIQISLTSGWDWVLFGFLMTLSKNQTFGILPNVGNVLILTKFAWEKMSLVSDEISDQSWEHAAQTVLDEDRLDEDTWIWDIGAPDVQFSPYLLLKHLHMVNIKPPLTWWL